MNKHYSTIEKFFGENFVPGGLILGVAYVEASQGYLPIFSGVTSIAYGLYKYANKESLLKPIVLFSGAGLVHIINQVLYH